MAASLPSKISIVVAAAVPIAAYQAASVFAPLVLAIFIIAIVWPLQSRLQLRVPKLLALAITLIITVAVCICLRVAGRLGLRARRIFPRCQLGTVPSALSEPS
jgi:predicted PurR-regulated permease PerM